MCPCCGNLFSLGRASSSEQSPAVSGSATGANADSPDYSYYIPDFPRPVGVTAVGVIGIILSGLLILSMTCLGTTIVVPELAAEMQKNMPEGEYPPAGGAGFWAGIIIVWAIGLVYLWSSIRLLRRKEAARRLVWGISICGAIVTGIPLIYTWKEFLAIEALGENLIIVSLFTYSIFAFIYLQRQVVKNWFAG